MPAHEFAGVQFPGREAGSTRASAPQDFAGREWCLTDIAVSGISSCRDIAPTDNS